MGVKDNISNKAEEAKGKIKEGVGDATDNKRLEREGQADQGKAKIKQAGQDVKDAVTEFADDVKNSSRDATR